MNALLKTLSLTILAGVALAPQADAQNRSRSHRVSIGNSAIGIDFRSWARAKNTDGNPRVDTVINAPVHFLGWTGDLQRAACTARKVGSGFSGSFNLRVGPYTRSSGSVSANSRKRERRHWSVWPHDPSQTFWVGPIPITVSGNAGFTADVDMYFTNLSTGVALSGECNSYASAWASAGVGVSGAQIGLRFVLRLGEQQLEGYLGAFRSSLRTDLLNYRFTPVSLYLMLFAEFAWLRWEKTIVSASYGRQTFAPFIR